MAIFTNQATLSYRNGAVSSNVVTGEIVEVLSATKTALPDTYSAGDGITYVVSIINTGNAAVSGVTVSDDLGAYAFGSTTVIPLTYVEGSAAYYVGGILQPAPTVTQGTNLVFSGITVPANGNAILVYQARANEFAPIADGGQITNTATVSGGGESVTVSETVNAASEPLLGITKAVSPTTVSENGQLTYTFTVQNFGNAEAGVDDALIITDVFDPILDPITVNYNGAVWTEGTEYNYDPSTGSFATVAGNITVPAATFTQDSATGEWNVVPGTVTLTVIGTV